MLPAVTPLLPWHPEGRPTVAAARDAARPLLANHSLLLVPGAVLRYELLLGAAASASTAIFGVGGVAVNGLDRAPHLCSVLYGGGVRERLAIRVGQIWEKTAVAFRNNGTAGGGRDPGVRSFHEQKPSQPRGAMLPFEKSTEQAGGADERHSRGDAKLGEEKGEQRKKGGAKCTETVER